MNRIKSVLTRTQPPLSSTYAPLPGAEPSSQHHGDAEASHPVSSVRPFLRGDYAVFVLLGTAMLWAWNMFLAAAPYFSARLTPEPSSMKPGDPPTWIETHFQSAILTTSTLVNLFSMLYLTSAQPMSSTSDATAEKRAPSFGSFTYPARISWSFIINTGTFALLSLSTRIFLSVSPAVYFAFLLLMVATSSFGIALGQNGVFSYAAGLGEIRYTSAVMVGQALAGVLPCFVQVVDEIRVVSQQASGVKGQTDPNGARSNALNWFLVAMLVEILALVAFGWHLRRADLRSHPLLLPSGTKPEEEEDAGSPVPEERPTPAHHIPLRSLLRTLRLPASAIIFTFAISMMFPLFTPLIHSIHETIDRTRTSSALNAFPVFVPLGFLFWNLGDLTGRLLSAFRLFDFSARPGVLLLVSLARILFVTPGYYLCNINDRGAAVGSDVWYLVVQQWGFGATNGWIGSCCMMGAGGEVVKRRVKDGRGTEEAEVEREKEAAGSLMGMCLVAGLTVGSLLSFMIRV